MCSCRSETLTCRLNKCWDSHCFWELYMCRPYLTTSFIFWSLDPWTYSFLVLTGLGRQQSVWSVVKTCSVVFVFPHCCLPLFLLEELFPFPAWKQAAGQRQVSLLFVVRSPGQPPFVLPTIGQSNLFVQITFCPLIFHINHVGSLFSPKIPLFYFTVSVHVFFHFPKHFLFWRNNPSHFGLGSGTLCN